MALKVYLKKGNLNYKERRLITKLQEAIGKKIESDPSFASTFNPATSPAELQALHDRYCAETVEFEEIKTNSGGAKKPPIDTVDNETAEDDSEESNQDNTEQMSENKKEFVDPFNKEEPIVRDYVLDEGMKELGKGTEQPTNTSGSFGEPVTFEESFQLPGEENNSQSNQKGPQQKKYQAESKTNPVNPKFNEQVDSSKKKKTKRFAKNIVNAVCALTEKGFVWYATRNINESKLAEYEMNDEVDLQVLVTLEEGQQHTIKQFFQMQCANAEQLSKITKEQKEDLIEDLYEVMMEKGVAPTPIQSLLMSYGEILLNQGLAIFISEQQTGSVLTQLKQMKAEEKGTKYEDVSDKKPQPKAEHKAEDSKKDEVQVVEVVENEEAPVKDDVLKEVENYNAEVETKE